MGFQQVNRALDECIKLPVVQPDGSTKIYEIPDVDAKTGIWCQEMLTIGVAVYEGAAPTEAGQLDDDDERNLFQRVLGPVYQEMVDDGVKWRWLKRAGMTAFLWAAGNEELAQEFWNTGGDPKALEQTKRAQQNRASRRSGSKKKRAGGAGNTTPAPASTSGTKPPRPQG